jgi:hypothetical protein
MIAAQAKVIQRAQATTSAEVPRPRLLDLKHVSMSDGDQCLLFTKGLQQALFNMSKLFKYVQLLCTRAATSLYRSSQY